MARTIRKTGGIGGHSSPARTPEEREDQMISLTIDAVEKRIREGTASSQEYVHFLKLGSTKEKLELEKLKKENELLRAKTEAIQSAKHAEELFQEAIHAMGIYRGERLEDEEDEED